MRPALTLFQFARGWGLTLTVAVVSVGVAAAQGDGPRPQDRERAESKEPVDDYRRDGDARRDKDQPGRDVKRGDDQRDEARRDGDRHRDDVGEHPPRFRGGGRPVESFAPPRPPRAPRIVEVLDRNGDGKLDQTELDLAIASLRTLDRNRDGELSREEMMGPPPVEARPGLFGQPQLLDRPRFFDRPQPGEGNRPPLLDRPPVRDGERPITERLRERFRPEGRETPPSTEALLRMFDKNRDGAISRGEAPERMSPAFERFDANGDSRLGAEELRTMREQFSTGRPQSVRPEAPGGQRPRRPDAEKGKD